MWTAADITIVLDDENSAGSVVTVRIQTPSGDLLLMADIERFDRELALAGVHIQGQNLAPNQLGWARLRQIARAVAEIADVDTIVVKGALRTSVRIQEGSSRVQFGSPARYELHAERPIVKSISAIKALARRHVPLIVAKQQIEELMVGRDVSIEVPMLEDAAVFEAELQELGIRAVKTAAAAAAEG